MDLRLIGCCAGALTLHVALLALGSLAWPSRLSPPLAPVDEIEIDLGEPSPGPEPPEVPAPVAPEQHVPAPEALPPPEARAMAPRRPPRAAVAPPGAAVAPPREALTPFEPAAADIPGAPVGGVKASRPRQPLSPADLGLGLGGNGSGAFLQQMRDSLTPAEQDVGGLRQELRKERMAQDTSLGLGPGGAVASAVRDSARAMAPLNSEATISVDLSADGSVAAISLDRVSSGDREWAALVSSLRDTLKSLSAKAGYRLRVTLLLTNRSTLRAGNPSGPFQFDLSNIGSPTLQSLHIRVLEQVPL